MSIKTLYRGYQILLTSCARLLSRSLLERYVVLTVTNMYSFNQDQVLKRLDDEDKSCIYSARDL